MKMRKLAIVAGTVATAGTMLAANPVSFADSMSGSSTMSNSSNMSGTSQQMRQMAKVSIVAPMQGDSIPADHYAIEVKITIPMKYQSKISVTPAFLTPTDPYFKPGASYYFPGLVVTDTGTIQKVGGPMKNLAGLFQVIGVRHDLSGNEIVDADWFVGKPLFSGVTMPCIRAYVVEGKAPDVLPTNPTNMDIGTMIQGITPISNIAKTDIYTDPAMPASKTS